MAKACGTLCECSAGFLFCYKSEIVQNCKVSTIFVNLIFQTQTANYGLSMFFPLCFKIFRRKQQHDQRA